MLFKHFFINKFHPHEVILKIFEFDLNTIKSSYDYEIDLDHSQTNLQNVQVVL